MVTIEFFKGLKSLIKSFMRMNIPFKVNSIDTKLKLKTRLILMIFWSIA